MCQPWVGYVKILFEDIIPPRFGMSRILSGSKQHQHQLPTNPDHEIDFDFSKIHSFKTSFDESSSSKVHLNMCPQSLSFFLYFVLTAPSYGEIKL